MEVCLVCHCCWCCWLFRARSGPPVWSLLQESRRLMWKRQSHFRYTHRQTHSKSSWRDDICIIPMNKTKKNWRRIHTHTQKLAFVQQHMYNLIINDKDIGYYCIICNIIYERVYKHNVRACNAAAVFAPELIIMKKETRGGNKRKKNTHTHLEKIKFFTHFECHIKVVPLFFLHVFFFSFFFFFRLFIFIHSLLARSFIRSNKFGTWVLYCTVVNLCSSLWERE